MLNPSDSYMYTHMTVHLQTIEAYCIYAASRCHLLIQSEAFSRQYLMTSFFLISSPSFIAEGKSSTVKSTIGEWREGGGRRRRRRGREEGREGRGGREEGGRGEMRDSLFQECCVPVRGKEKDIFRLHLFLFSSTACLQGVR